MRDKIEVKADLKKLNNVISGLTQANGVVIKVGILAGKNARDAGDTNAGIGLIHEFGSYTKHIPERSFLRMPLKKKSGEMMKEVQRLIETELVEGDVMPLLKKIGTVAEGAIGEAFATGGFGAWKPISKATEKRKGTDAILIETSQLQRSITSVVVPR